LSHTKTPLLIAQAAAAYLATIGIGALVVYDGELPSAFTTLFFVPIIFVAYRFPLAVSVGVASLASLFSSPLMAVAGVEVQSSILPVLWLGWPAVYLFAAVSLNQWNSLQQQRSQLDATERHLEEVRERNDRREHELETLSAIHTTILSGTDEPAIINEITRRVGEVCGARICTITVPVGTTGQRPLLPVGFTEEMFNRCFPKGAPYGEGVDGWAILHQRVAASSNVFEDPRYDRLRDFAALAGFASAAAAPLELDAEITGALMICYAEPHEFPSDELMRLERLARQTELAIRAVKQRESLGRFAFDTALALTEAIESRDPYTGGHCRRLADYGGVIAKKLALPPNEIEVVRLGAALHDMGKIVVPDAILKKPGKLTPEEYAIIKQHCYSGGQICKRVGFLMNAYPIVYHHHERWDGQGYPDSLKGEAIPMGARIVAVIDAYDSMTTDRPYRNAMPYEAAVEILKDGAGRQWDPTVVNVLLDTVRLEGDPHEHTDVREEGHAHGLILPERRSVTRAAEDLPEDDSPLPEQLEASGR
jgi:HD-GYP domain-containing protein (c-di-GMP phosphodiesterase class II)